MRITLENTKEFHEEKIKITIESDHDDMTLDRVIWDFVRPALIGFGFSVELVEEYLKECRL